MTRPSIYPTASPHAPMSRVVWRDRLARAARAMHAPAASAALGRLQALTREDVEPPDSSSPGAVAWFRQTRERPGFWNRAARKAAARELRKRFASL